jgi:hypothetical protein
LRQARKGLGSYESNKIRQAQIRVLGDEKTQTEKGKKKKKKKEKKKKQKPVLKKKITHKKPGLAATKETNNKINIAPVCSNYFRVVFRKFA